MPGLAEGDCQDLISISTSLDDAAIKRIDDTQVAMGNRQLAPLRQAFAKAGFGGGNPVPITKDRIPKFAALLDTIVALDSTGWLFHKYIRGSLNNVSVVSQSSNGSEMTLLGNYTFTEGENGRSLGGWVKAKIKNGDIDCLQYHDKGDECRAIRLPNVAITTVGEKVAKYDSGLSEAVSSPSDCAVNVVDTDANGHQVNSKDETRDVKELEPTRTVRGEWRIVVGKDRNGDRKEYWVGNEGFQRALGNRSCTP
jgi:hypothetical protein